MSKPPIPFPAPKFSLGQSVVVISSLWCTRKSRCFPCDATGRILVRGESFVCPKCKGARFHDDHAGHKHVIVNEGRIGKITVESTDPVYLRDDCSPPPTRISYMLSSTGVGSGALWYEEALFLTRDEAQAACDRLNAPINFADDVLPPPSPETLIQ